MVRIPVHETHQLTFSSMSVSLDKLPDELVCRVLYHWLQTSDAPITLRHCTAKYFDKQHHLNGHLTRHAIRKIVPTQQALKFHLFTNDIVVEYSDESSYSYSYDISITSSQIKTRMVDLYFPTKEKLKCNHNDHYLEDTKSISFSKSVSSNTSEASILMAPTRMLMLKCKHCKQSEDLRFFEYYVFANEFEGDYDYDKYHDLHMVFSRHFDDITVRELYNLKP